jgi:CRISPR-associated endoribonuclease Cas6
VTAYELKTYALKMEGGTEVGAQGWIRYRFSDAEMARMATILANFAFFAGVGRKTAMGMGQTQLGIQSFKNQNLQKPRRELRKDNEKSNRRERRGHGEIRRV